MCSVFLYVSSLVLTAMFTRINTVYKINTRLRIIFKCINVAKILIKCT